MPIRTRRGRVAAYRAVWEWPLYSPVRLAGIVAVVVALVVGVSALGGPAGSGGTSGTGPRPSGLAPAGTRPSVSVAPLELRPARLPVADAPPAALAVAARWTAAWTNHPAGVTAAQWSAGLAPYTTAEYLPVLASVDPAHVPGTRVTGPAVAVEVRPDALRAQVPTDAVRLELLLVRVAPSDWRVSGYDRAS